MADERQFGSPKVLRFGDKAAGNQADDVVQCAQCEAMLADALDGTLAADQQERFDAHGAECGLCSQMLADTRRGAAWLDMLRTPRPEPPATMVEQILAATSGAQGTLNAGRVVPGGMEHAGFAGVTPGRSPLVGAVAAVTPGFAPGAGASYGNMVPFRARAATALRTSSFGQILLQPRLAMTAAMAFFSIALTMNLTGIHPLSLRSSDLSPSSLTRDFTNAKASVVRYYDGLRVVYELESRVHDFEGASDSDLPAGRQSEPSNPGQPAVPSPSAQPGSGGRKDAAPEDRNPSEHKKPSANTGSSHREELNPSRRFVSVRRSGKSFDNLIQEPRERVMA
ncbi:MAG: anti-sigma factor family protein [Acidobacteriaceae bacterium]